jgi:hypothetical protein
MYYTDSDDNQMKMKSAEKVKSNAKMQFSITPGGSAQEAMIIKTLNYQ